MGRPGLPIRQQPAPRPLEPASCLAASVLLAEQVARLLQPVPAPVPVPVRKLVPVPAMVPVPVPTSRQEPLAMLSAAALAGPVAVAVVRRQRPPLSVRLRQKSGPGPVPRQVLGQVPEWRPAQLPGRVLGRRLWAGLHQPVRMRQQRSASRPPKLPLPCASASERAA